MSYEVAIVVARSSDSIRALAERMPVWACATAEHKRTAKAYWREAQSDDEKEKGITLFHVSTSISAEEMLLGVLYNVDLHHGEHSHDPPWTKLRVVGTKASAAVREALATFGVTNFIDSAEGFTCTR